MQGQHALAERKPNQVKALWIDFQRSVKLVDPAIPLHAEMLLQTNR